MRAERLSTTNHDLFESKIKELMLTSKDKNRDWWPHLLDSWNFMFGAWYIVFDKEDNLIAFSAVQPFENNQWRLMSRMWNGVRKQGLVRGLIENEISPAMLMLELQLKEFGNEKCFISMEYLNRRKFIEQLAKKMNKLFNVNWKLNEGMQKTCNDLESFSCWQNTISNHPIELPSISVEQYKQYFEGERKR